MDWPCQVLTQGSTREQCSAGAGAVPAHPETLARASPAGPLLGSHLADSCDQQAVAVSLGAEPDLLHKARVHHVQDAVNRDGHLRDICGHHDLPEASACRTEHFSFACEVRI